MEKANAEETKKVDDGGKKGKNGSNLREGNNVKGMEESCSSDPSQLAKIS